MREIKFRAWHNRYDRKQPAVMLYEEKAGDVFAWHNMGQPIEIMQYTSLKDKNGFDIYEGDILFISSGHKQHTKSKWLVGFECGAFGIFKDGSVTPSMFSSFANYRDGCEQNGADTDISKHLTIIGNIHQNPELLPK